eukprot:CAMPEP_0172732746 /NCGR_PEP_ID=MMETSP1074-20121228/105169_1 /TAXON_ID=2916 /ORGANISM="Ceratium fusus, Strain PA161109" /LENGTH=163 /DNA_ID=CAMNT_0013561107 /DNA_START=109 /DNA_END=597 /DNA_ORIENTATION=-
MAASLGEDAPLVKTIAMCAAVALSARTQKGSRQRGSRSYTLRYAIEPNVASVSAMRFRLEASWKKQARESPVQSISPAENEISLGGAKDAEISKWLPSSEDVDTWMGYLLSILSIVLLVSMVVELYQQFSLPSHSSSHEALIVMCAALCVRRLRKASRGRKLK